MSCLMCRAPVGAKVAIWPSHQARGAASGWAIAMAFDHPELMPQMLAKRAAQQGGGTALQHVDGSALRW